MKQRLKEGKSINKCDQSEELQGLGGKPLVRITEYLEIAAIDERKVIRCLRCGKILCGAEHNYKEYALYIERGISPVMGGAPRAFYQEYICPGCGILLQVDVLCPELESDKDHILWDIQLDI